MAFFDLLRQVPNRRIRFRRPEFQEKLERARRFQRKAIPLSEGLGEWVLQKLGLRSRPSRLLSLILLLLIAYFLFISNLFLVKNAELLSAEPSPEQVREVLKLLKWKRIYLVPSSHILILNQKMMLAALQQELPQVRTLTQFKKIFPDRVALAIEERKPLYVWQSGVNYYLLDQDGVVFQKVLNYDPATFFELLITDLTVTEVRIGQELDTKKILGFIEQLQALWPQKIQETNFLSFSVPSVRSPDIFVRTAIGFQVYFDLERSVNVQLTHLDRLLGQEIRPETYTGLSYIDLRLPNIAYYCYQDAPCAAPPPLPIP